MATSESTQILDELMNTLDGKLSQVVASNLAGAVQGAVNHGDAIQAVLAEAPRQTAVTSLRDAPVVEQFRQALIDGLIRTDTVNQLLKLVNEVVTRLVL